MVDDNPQVINTTVWQWAGYALTGLVVLSFLPNKSLRWAIAVILLGGYFILSKKGGINGLIQTFQTMGRK